jgi:hypothetical protein
MLAKPVLTAVLLTLVTDIAPVPVVAPSPAERACTEYAALRCAKIDVCSRHTQVVLLYGEASTCLWRERVACEGRISAPGSNVTPSYVSACSASIRDASCAEWQKSTGCRPPPGTQPVGSRCSVGAQCASTFCSVPKGAASGACAELPGEGKPCDGPCAAGTFCGTNGRCDTIVGEGEPCDEAHYCAAGVRCVRASDEAAFGVCVRAAWLGEPCDARAVGAASCDGFAMLTCGESSGLCEDDVLSVVQVVSRMAD